MKRNFIKVLPLAAAVLLATSCSKDENNDNEVINNEVINNEQQEIVVSKPQTITVSGTIENKAGLSKEAGTIDIDFAGAGIWFRSIQNTVISGSTAVWTCAKAATVDPGDGSTFTFTATFDITGVNLADISTTDVTYVTDVIIFDTHTEVPMLKWNLAYLKATITTEGTGTDSETKISGLDLGDLNSGYYTNEAAYMFNAMNEGKDMTISCSSSFENYKGETITTSFSTTIADGTWCAVPDKASITVIYNEKTQYFGGTPSKDCYYVINKTNWEDTHKWLYPAVTAGQ